MYKNAKNAFTLAEVLLTLAIVGIVTSLTVPAVINEVELIESKTGNKIAYNFLSKAITQIINDNGGNIEGIGTNLDNLLGNQISISNKGNDWHNTNSWYFLNGNPCTTGTGWSVLKLQNGMLLHTYLATTCNITTYGYPRGKTICGFIYADINGYKKPNKIGKDIFLYWLINEGVVPTGTNGDLYANTCTTTSSGWGCAAKYLKE